MVAQGRLSELWAEAYSATGRLSALWAETVGPVGRLSSLWAETTLVATGRVSKLWAEVGGTFDVFPGDDQVTDPWAPIELNAYVPIGDDADTWVWSVKSVTPALPAYAALVLVVDPLDPSLVRFTAPATESTTVIVLTATGTRAGEAAAADVQITVRPHSGWWLVTAGPTGPVVPFREATF